MKIGIDLDGVIANVVPELVTRLKGIGIVSDPKDWTSMYVEERHPELPEKWASQQFSDPLFFLNAIADESAFYCVNRWFYGGHDVYIVTCRPEEFRDVTERWLDEWAIPYNNLFMGARKYHKSEILSEVGCSLMVEDDGQEADAVAMSGIDSYLRLHPYNQAYRANFKVRKVRDLYAVDGVISERFSIL